MDALEYMYTLKLKNARRSTARSHFDTLCDAFTGEGLLDFIRVGVVSLGDSTCVRGVRR